MPKNLKKIFPIFIYTLNIYFIPYVFIYKYREQNSPKNNAYLNKVYLLLFDVTKQSR